MRKFLATIAASAVIAIVFATPTSANFGRQTFLPMTMGSYYWATVINCNEWIPLREYPSTEAAHLAKIPLGAKVKIYKGQLGERSLSPSNGFYRTQYNGRYGWCLMEYIRVGALAESVP